MINSFPGRVNILWDEKKTRTNRAKKNRKTEIYKNIGVFSMHILLKSDDKMTFGISSKIIARKVKSQNGQFELCPFHPVFGEFGY